MNNSDLMTASTAPNKMYPLTWIVLGLVLAGVLVGFSFMLAGYLKTRVAWKKLPMNEALSYFGKNVVVDTALLYYAWVRTKELLLKHCGPKQPKWTEQTLAKALGDVRIYVMDTDKWTDEFGRTVAGIQKGRDLMVGRNLAALLHECAHRCEEVIDNERDMDHLTWVSDGIRAAEDEFSAWLATQKVL